MTISITVPVYQRKAGSTIALTTLGLGGLTQNASGPTIPRAEQLLRDALKSCVRGVRPIDLLRFDLKRGTKLTRVRLELNLKDQGRRKVSGLCPLIVEPRFVGDDHAPMEICYHPARQHEWFPLPQHSPVEEAAAAYFSETWSELSDEAIVAMWSNAKDSLRAFSFTANERTLLEELPNRKKGLWDDLEVDPTQAEKRKKQPLKVLPALGTDLTARIPLEPGGLPRAPYREQLLLGAQQRQSVVVVGPSGCGKSTIIEQLVSDLLVHDGFTAHRNLDKCTHVWRVQGKDLIAGMSRVGQWEQRCVDLLDDVRGKKVILLVPDVHLFGRIGRARDSDRALSDFFRGPIARGELTILGECTPSQLSRLQEDDPAFAASFVPLHVGPATADQTFRMMLARARTIEVESPEDAPVEMDARTFQTIAELSAGLFPSHALPGNAVDLLVRLYTTREREAAPKKGEPRARVIMPADVIDHLSQETGLPWVLLSPDKPLDVADIREELEQRVMGQPVAVQEAADLVARIRSGLTDPKRPYGVYLFTGPTGTGKTELAKALAHYLYGDTARLLRFDMSELSGPDAVARLIGDAWNPEGALTSAAMAQPFSVVLLDEIEKAHPAVLNLLLQLFDDGRLTDAAGNTTSFTQCVVVMTSNLGARQRAPVGFDAPPEGLMHDVARAVREFFPPELFNRIDAVVPFRPLTPEIAVDVTKKELAKLFGRSGLTERNVFVQVSPAAVQRIAREALRAEDGARSLKRFIEDRIGSLLGEQIAKAPGAAMQVLRIADSAEGLDVESEPLVEAQPVAHGYALEGVWNRPMTELRAQLPETILALDALEKSDRLALLSEQLRDHLSAHNRGLREHGEPLYNIEWMRMTIRALRERVEGLTVMSQDLAHHAIETAIVAREAAVYPHGWKDVKPTWKSRRERMRHDFGGSGNWWDLFSAIAETYVLTRALDKVTGQDQHAVFVELLPFGSGRTFIKEMMKAYGTARGGLDTVAWVSRDEVFDGSGKGALESALAAEPDFVVMKLVGMCIKDYLELETGTHVWRPTVREPELLRVRVLPVPPNATSRQQIEAFLAARNDRLLPVVRTIQFDPPLPQRPPNMLSMEDFVLGMPYDARVANLGDVFTRLWLLRVSRIEVPS